MPFSASGETFQFSGTLEGAGDGVMDGVAETSVLDDVELWPELEAIMEISSVFPVTTEL